MNKKFISIACLFFVPLYSSFGAFPGSGSSNFWLTKDEQEAIDADLAFELMQKEQRPVAGAVDAYSFPLEDQDRLIAEQLDYDLNAGSSAAVSSTTRTVRPSFTTPSSVHYNFLPLPQRFARKAVYYARVNPHYDFSCVYNVLYNAARFEQAWGFGNVYANAQEFSRKVLPFVRAQSANPRGATDTIVAEYLAKHELNMQPLYTVFLKDDDSIGLMLPDELRISYQGRPSQQQINLLFEQERTRKQQQMEQEICHYLEAHSKAVVHFLCAVYSGTTSHALLVSLYKDEVGRRLFMFDNMNDRCESSSISAKCLDYLCDTFTVSYKS